ncbi:hypothetical protein [Flavobacterium reichenbachii]|uniref:Uncharacterized protein n=1 Tax=Flavobacterium reichenbachii TaxID=362418 RepID=A0A085ZRF5_9FLAO|nr:hypothetical protein [Flavobacterium reichenbachii]KFF07019.1 hypothetical protein IW19_16530 [Flavobacterium reichenbachii]OXB12008.1 hypothetical protein B0A68_19980 [Flavobacterium reichenbachii]
MAKIFLGYMICFLLLNCGKKGEKIVEKNKPYIISYEDRKLKNYIDSLKKSKSNFAAYPRKGFYGEHQLLIDKNGNLYFYQKEYFMKTCSYGSENDTLPHFLRLEPKDIIKVPQKNLTNFLSENILAKEKDRQILIVASQNDTIKNTSFFEFLNTKNIGTYIIRRTTQEEDTVLKYKNNNNKHVYYYPDSIKWNKTKIKLIKKIN